MSWFNLNDKLTNITDQLSSFANNVLTDEVPDPNKTNNELEEIQKICVNQQEEINRLKRINEKLAKEKGPLETVKNETNWSWDIPKTDNNSEIISNLKQEIIKLENDKKDLMESLELLDSEYKENTDKLVNIKNNLQCDYNELEKNYLELNQKSYNVNNRNLMNESNVELSEKYEKLLEDNQKFKLNYENLEKEFTVLNDNNQVLGNTNKAKEEEIKNLNEKLKLFESENKIITKELKKVNQNNLELQEKIAIDTENYQKLAFILEEYEGQVKILKEELNLANNNNDEGKIDNLQNQLDKIIVEKEEIHGKYINILTEMLKKYVDYDKLSSKNNQNILIKNENNQQLIEFTNQIENILKILLDLKCKCNDFEKELYDVSEEKTKILKEKNYEIEKLLQNSEILSQEVITKTETIKEYKNECDELMKNNDLLINELENYKNNSCLQTISETNEDNLLLLETQLENANKKIKDLEKNLQESNQEIEIQQTENNYQQLLNNFNKIQIENNLLKNDNEQETEKLNLIIEKLRTDLENTEYQYTELNINSDSLKDEIEIQKENIEKLTYENKILIQSNEELKYFNNNLTEKLNLIEKQFLIEEQQRKNYEIELRNLNEKLQKSKMSETSLKLQYDTINKELITINEIKNNVEIKLNQTVNSLTECQKFSNRLQEENDELKSVKSNENVEGEKKFEFVNNEKEECDRLINNSPENDKKQDVNQDYTSLLTQFQDLKNELNLLKDENNNLKLNTERNLLLEKQIEELNSSKNELTNIILTKHQENITYHQEIQRLAQILKEEKEKNHNFELQLKHLKENDLNEKLTIELNNKNEELQKLNELIEKLQDQNNFLKEKCEVLAKSLLEEQNQIQKILNEKSNCSEKEQNLLKKLERLQTHLIEVEDHYTQELLQAVEKNNELQSKVNEIEQREKNSSTMYTSVSIRANQHVESLQHQLQLITSQRDELRKKISDAEDEYNKQAAALTNLQLVLEQFQKDKDGLVAKETERIRRQINAEKQIQNELKIEITNLQLQLNESKQGLQAASRLSNQLESSKKLITTLKEEVSQLEGKLAKSEEKLLELSNQKDGKIDKCLIKNLIIGLIITNNHLNKDQLQILKSIATVLDFNQQDHDKINKSQQGSWLGSLLPSSQNPSSANKESLSHAFVKFLEDESKPRVVPSLLNDVQKSEMKEEIKRKSPILMSEIVLPTFADFAQSRNSGSILKDVLKDNT